MDGGVWESLQRWFFPLSIAGSFLVLFVAQFLLDTITAIKGGYVLLGLLIAVVVYRTTDADHLDADSSIAAVSIDDGKPDETRVDTVGRFTQSEKGVYIIIALTIAASALLGERFYPLLIGLLVGYALLGYQLFARRWSSRLLTQVLGLYLVSPVSQYLTTGFYFGPGDTFTHVRLVESLMESGTIEALTLYSGFPGFHTFVGAVSMVAGVPAYDGLQLVGITSFSALIVLIYLVADSLHGQRFAIFAALALTLMDSIVFFATYFFPQSLAVVLFTFLLYVALRTYPRNSADLRLTICGLVVVPAVVLTHHLTVVLLVPLFGFAVVSEWWTTSRAGGSNWSIGVPTHRLSLVFVTGLLALTYWSFTEEFIGMFAVFVLGKLDSQLVASGSSKPILTYAIGTSIPSLTLWDSVLSLFSPEGIYFILLTSTFVLGLVSVLDAPRKYVRMTGLVSTGVLSVVLVMRTPFALPGIERLRLPASIFFAFVIAIGLRRLLDSRPKVPGVRHLTLALFVVFAATTPIVAGDDLYRAHAGPGLYELQPLPEPQRELSSGEVEQLAATSRFIETHGSTSRVTTFGVTARALSRFGSESTGRVSIVESGLRTGEGLFVYRERWTDHTVVFSPAEYSLSSLVISEEWLDTTLQRENKVYDTGSVGILWRNEPGVLNEAVNATNATTS